MKLAPYGVVFSGGGALGAWEVGCLDVLVKAHDGAFPTVVTGASAGSINAVAVALGMSIGQLKAAWVEMRDSDVFNKAPPRRKWAKLGAVFAINALRKWSIQDSIAMLSEQLPSLYDATPLGETLARLLGGARYDQLASFQGKLVIAATNLTSSSRKYYCYPEKAIPTGSDWVAIKSFDVLKGAMLASAAIPILFEPLNNEVDGGVLHNQPLAAAHALLAEGDPIYVLVPQADVPVPALTNLKLLGLRLIDTWMSQGFRSEVANVALDNTAALARDSKLRPVCVIQAGISLETVGSGLLKFGKKVDEIVDRGRTDAENALANFNANDESTWPVELRRGTELMRKRLRAAEESARNTAISMQDQIVQRFGFKARRLEWALTVTDADGNAFGTRKWEGVRVSPNHSVAFLPDVFAVNTPGGEIVGPPRLTVGRGFGGKGVSLVVKSQTATECKFRVEAAGGLVAGDPELAYTVRADYKRAVLMTAEAVQRAFANDLFKYDYLGYDVAVPIDELVLKVEFPRGTKVSTFGSVFFGESEQVHNGEWERVKGGFTSYGSIATFVITEPLPTFRYVIYWTFDDGAQ